MGGKTHPMRSAVAVLLYLSVLHFSVCEPSQPIPQWAWDAARLRSNAPGLRALILSDKDINFNATHYQYGSFFEHALQNTMPEDGIVQALLQRGFYHPISVTKLPENYSRSTLFKYYIGNLFPHEIICRRYAEYAGQALLHLVASSISLDGFEDLYNETISHCDRNIVTVSPFWQSDGSLLRTAIRLGSLHVARSLVENFGIDVNNPVLYDTNCRPPLSGFDVKHPETFEPALYLLLKNASLLSSSHCNEYGLSFLHYASVDATFLKKVFQLRPEAALLLRSHSARRQWSDGKPEITPFQHAVLISDNGGCWTPIEAFEAMIDAGMPVGASANGVSALAEVLCAFPRSTHSFSVQDFQRRVQLFLAASAPDSTAAACSVGLPVFQEDILSLYRGPILEPCRCYGLPEAYPFVVALEQLDMNMATLLIPRIDIHVRPLLSNRADYRMEADLLCHVALSSFRPAEKIALMQRLISAGFAANQSDVFDKVVQWLIHASESRQSYTSSTFQLEVAEYLETVAPLSFDVRNVVSAHRIPALRAILPLFLRGGVPADELAMEWSRSASLDQLATISSHLGANCSGLAGAQMLHDVITSSKPLEEQRQAIETLLACGAHPREFTRSCSYPIQAATSSPILERLRAITRMSPSESIIRTLQMPNFTLASICLKNLFPFDWPTCQTLFPDSPVQPLMDIDTILSSYSTPILYLVSKSCFISLGQTLVRTGNHSALAILIDYSMGKRDVDFFFDAVGFQWIVSSLTLPNAESLLQQLLRLPMPVISSQMWQHCDPVVHKDKLALMIQAGVISKLPTEVQARAFVKPLRRRQFGAAEALYQRYSVSPDARRLIFGGDSWSDPLRAAVDSCNATWLSRVLEDARAVGWKWHFTEKYSPFEWQHLYDVQCNESLGLLLSAHDFSAPITEVSMLQATHSLLLLPTLLRDRRVNSSMWSPLRDLLVRSPQISQPRFISVIKDIINLGVPIELLAANPAAALLHFLDDSIHPNTSSADREWLFGLLEGRIRQSPERCCVTSPCKLAERYVGPDCRQSSVLEIWLSQHERWYSSRHNAIYAITNHGSGINSRVFSGGRTMLHWIGDHQRNQYRNYLPIALDALKEANADATIVDWTGRTACDVLGDIRNRFPCPASPDSHVPFQESHLYHESTDEMEIISSDDWVLPASDQPERGVSTPLGSSDRSDQSDQSDQSTSFVRAPYGIAIIASSTLIFVGVLVAIGWHIYRKRNVAPAGQEVEMEPIALLDES